MVPLLRRSSRALPYDTALLAVRTLLLPGPPGPLATSEPAATASSSSPLDGEAAVDPAAATAVAAAAAERTAAAELSRLLRVLLREGPESDVRPLELKADALWAQGGDVALDQAVNAYQDALEKDAAGCSLKVSLSLGSTEHCLMVQRGEQVGEDGCAVVLRGWRGGAGVRMHCG